MVQINGEDFQIYDLDTDMSILSRIAIVLNTLPKYLYFSDGAPTMEQFKTNTDIKVEDALSIIKNYDSIRFIPLYEDLKSKIIISNLTNDLINPFIVYNPEIKQQISANPENFDMFLDLVQREIKTLNLTPDLDIRQVWNNREGIIRNLELNINDNRRNSETQVRNFTRIENAAELVFTEFELERDRNELKLNLNNITLIEIFNYIKLNDNAPFASLNNFYKILKDFYPYEEWSVTTDDIILMVSPYTNILTNPKINDYSTVIIEESEENEMVVNFYFNKSSNNLDKKQLIERIVGTFPKLEPLEIKSLVSDNISGVFYFPLRTLNKHVLSDLIMNDPLFSAMLSVNEGTKATKTRSSIFVYFNHLNTGPITATLTEKVMTKLDTTMKNKDSKLFPRGQKYIRVKIKNARDQEAIQEFQIILSKLMTLYYEEYPKIVEIYREFIPDFGVNVLEVSGDSAIEEEENIFPSGFTRKCGSKPTVITSKEEEEAAIEAGKDIMIFPRDQDANLTKQRKYVCNYIDKPYPGLIENIDKKSKFPLLPCCYGNDPRNIKYPKHAKFREYYGLQEQEEKTLKTVQQNLIKTNKFVDFKIFGLLPKNINKLFSIIETDGQYSYLRTGVFKTKHSFLNCVLLAIGDETIQSLDEVEEIEAYLSYFRNSPDLLSPELAAACKQEMYDYSTEEIMLNIKDTDIYFDPKLFIHLLEEKFNCNIFLFSRDIENGGMVLPRHVQSYQKIKNNNPCIFIYEHSGSESDRAEYPRCELIVKFNNADSKDITYIFNQENTIYNEMNKVYKSLRETYSLDKLNEENEFPLVGKTQKIDSYGKVRMLNVEYEDRLITVMTSPIQPSAVQETMEESVSKVDVNTATRFAARQKMRISGQTIVDGKLKEIFGKIGNVRVSIPIEETEPLPTVPQFSRSLNYVEKNTSALETYNRNKKLARYIVEYMIWLYSKFLRDNDIIELIPEQMIPFANQYITIDPLFEYGKVPKKFNERSGVMYDGKLVVKSQETLKRLLYVLRLEAVRNPQRILKYYERDNIENFYIDITDFDQYQSQVILEGKDSVEKWSQERKVNYTLYNDIFIGNPPYFFKNKLVGNDLFLAQNTESLEKAVAIAQNWYEKGYNPSNTISETGLVEFTLLAFGGSNNIKPYSIQGPNYPENIKILGYKLNNESHFTVLLPV